ncbi:MAG: hypothetical protein Crog4KO_06560 [Crocinitomicaceae bacterium]
MLLLTFAANSQVVGGRENGEMTPTAAKPSSLSGGSLKGDVNPMTGEFSSSVALGSVSTPGGLGYNLSLDYSSSFSLSSSQAMTSGIPYGEGWGPNLPTISVEVDAFHKFTCSDLSYLPTDTTKVYNDASTNPQGRDEGDLYWFSPVINIPGVASGRAVFKYIDEADHKCLVFALNKFDTPVEIRFYGNRGWEIRVANGNTYTLRTQLKSFSAPDAQRVLHYEQSAPLSNNQQLDAVTNSDNSAIAPYGTNGEAVQNVIEPKESFTVWYCDQIFNLNLPKQSIHFQYKKYGAFNYFQEFNQEYYANVRSSIFGDSKNTMDSVYSDIHLLRIYSAVDATPVDIVELNYNTLKQDMDNNTIVDGITILDKDDPDVTPIDDLYNSIVVHAWGSNVGQMTFNGSGNDIGWRRYKHAAHPDYSVSLNSSSVGSANPYLRSPGTTPFYDTEDISSSNDAPFDHGFLESDRLFSNGTGYFPGDIYEVRTKVLRNTNQSLDNGNGTIDIAIKTGNNGNYPGNETTGSYPGHSNPMNTQTYEARKGIEIFSTFNSPLKWQMGYGQGSVNTSNFFVMPNIPSKYFGFNIQVGPGNSDIDFGSEYQNNTDLIQNGAFDAREAYPYTDNNVRDIRATDRIPHNFGTGHPWAMMIPIYNEMALNRSGFGGSASQPEELYENWWATPLSISQAQSLGHTITNTPTKFDENVKLSEVELVRYSKNALMLDSVITYKVSGEFKGLEDDERTAWNVVSKKKLHYRVKNETLLRNYDYSNGDDLINEQLQRKVILLVKISEVPVNGDLDLTDFGLADPTQVLTTTLEYDKYLDAASIANPEYDDLEVVKYIEGMNQYVLTAYTDALGGITRVEYYPFDDASTRFQNLYQYGECNVSAQATVTQPFGRDHAFTVHPAVRFLAKNDEGDQLLSSSNMLVGGNVNPELKVWEYEYNTSDLMVVPKKLELPTDHFSGHFFQGNEMAFKNVTVYEPFVDANATGRNYTEYEYFGNKQSEQAITESEFLYYGKPKHIKRYSYNGVLEEETIFEYGHTLAFENGYLRPNPLREHFWNENPIVQEYEYQDIQKNEVLSISGQTGVNAYSYLDVPYLNGVYTDREMPKLLSFYFFDELLANNDDFQLNSYFIKKTGETHRTYEDGLSKAKIVVAPDINVSSMPDNNPFGIGHTNSVSDNPTKDNPLIAFIDPNDEETMLDELTAESPLSDAVLTALVQSGVSGSSKYTILNLQGNLSNAVWSDIWTNLSTMSSSDIELLAENQSYISDQVILDMFAVLTRRSSSSMVDAVLLKNPYLSGQVINQMILSTVEVNGTSVANVMAAQPQLPESDLINIINSTKAYGSNVHTILSNQFVTDVIYTDMLDGTKYVPEDVTKVIENNNNFPIDPTLIEIIKHTPAFTTNQLERIFGQADRPIGHLVFDELVLSIGQAPADDIFSELETDNSLSQFCGSSVTTDRTFIETNTTYEYYEADHRGRAVGVAYELLLGMRDKFNGQSQLPFSISSSEPHNLTGATKVVDTLHLKHEPSWMLFSTTTSSPHLEGAYGREEYFYNFDLRNRYDRHWYNYDYDNSAANYTPQELTVGGHTKILVSNDLWDSYYQSGAYAAPEVPKFDAMSRTQELGNRSLAFQKTSITKNARDTEPKYASEYYFYEKGWVVAGYPGDAESIEFTTPQGNCPQAPPSNDPCPNYTDCNDCYTVFYKPFMDWEELVPLGYCAWHVPSIGYLICPEGHDPTGDFPNETVTQEHCGSYPTTSSSLPYSQTFDDMVQLRSVFVQVDDIDHSTTQEFVNNKMDGENDYIAEFYMGAPVQQGLPAHHMILPSDHLHVREVLERNRFTQVALEENSVGLQTKYHYNRTKYIWNYDPTCPILNYTSRLNEDIGLPTKVEVGYGLSNVLITEFEYNPVGLISKTTDPNGKTMDYAFDDYYRLIEVSEDGGTGTRLLTEYEYHSWDLDPLSTFDDRTNGNYVQTKNYSSSDLSFYEHTNAYVDPLGRNQGSAMSYTTDGFDHKTIHSGYVSYDNLGRVIATEKVYTSLSVAPTLNSPTIPMAQPFGGVIEEVLFEGGYKGRPERSSNFGVDVNGVHAIKTSYAIANHVYASCELELNLNELYQVMRPGGTNNVRLFRTDVYDQDDKRSVSYKNALGQDVALLRYNDNNEKIVTLFVYDSYGNLTRTINPEKQESDYIYNRLGQLVIENTVDAGAKHYMYNKQGLVSIIRDEQGRTRMDGSDRDPFYRVMEYDVFGRLTTQGRSEIDGENHTFLFNNEVYGPLHYKDYFIGTSPGVEILDPVSQTMKYFDYTFSDAQTQDYLYSYDYLDGSSITTTTGLAVGEMDIDLREKTVGYGSQQSTYELGRVTQTVSYNESDQPIQAISFTYDNIGHILTQTVEFNKMELWQMPTSQYNQTSLIEYPEYNYRGALLEEKVDVNDDGVVDFHCFMDYDPLNRLTAIYGATGLVNKADATLLISYEYDDISGQMSKREHTVWDGLNGVLALANQISYDYDERDRLTNIKSGLMSFGQAPMFDYDMMYDDQVVSFNDGTYSSSVTHDQNWNGNVNGIQAGYDFTGTNIINNVQGFDGPTVYGYDYDAINRLIEADGTVSDLLDAQNLNDSYRIGDVTIDYDRIGNIKTLRRSLRNSDQTQGAPYMIMQGFSYSYATDKNQLMAASGLYQGTATRAYTYDIIGNVLTDSYRNITGTEYGRGAYAFELTIDPDGIPQNQDDESVSYLYSSSDLRIYKKHVTSSQTLEDYYLMDASGRIVAILKEGYPSDGWEYYVNGAEREVRVSPQAGLQPGSNASATVAQKRVGLGQAVYYVNDHLGNTRITYAPALGETSTGRVVYEEDFETTNAPAGWIAGDGQFDSNALNELVFTTNANATNQNASYILNTSQLVIGDSYILSLDVNLGNSPDLNATILGTDLLSEDLNNGYNEIPFTYTGGISPVLIVSVTNGNGQQQQFTFSIDNIFVGTVAGQYAKNKVEYVADYFPYGKILREFVESEEERFLTTQHERDAETGLDYRGARYYDSDVARFLSLDPYAANYPSLSDYSYVGGNPIIFTDPNGKEIIPFHESEVKETVTHKVEMNDDGSSTQTFINKTTWKKMVKNADGTYTVTSTTVVTTTKFEVSAENGMVHKFTSSWEKSSSRNYKKYRNAHGSFSYKAIGGSTITDGVTTALTEEDIQASTLGYISGVELLLKKYGYETNPLKIPKFPEISSTEAGAAEAGSGILLRTGLKKVPFVGQLIEGFGYGTILGSLYLKYLSPNEREYTIQHQRDGVTINYGDD